MVQLKLCGYTDMHRCSHSKSRFSHDEVPTVLAQCVGCKIFICTPQPLYNTVRYNTVLDTTRISVGPQLFILDLFSYITIHFTLVITRFG